MEDWDRQPAGIKQAWGFKAVSQLHATSGCFLHAMDELKTKLSEKDYDDITEPAEQQFMNQLMDSDFMNIMSGSVPPIALASVPFFRHHFFCGDRMGLSAKNENSDHR